MSYNTQLPHVSTAGKITIVTTLFGVAAFLFVFLFNLGQSEFQTAEAQSTATTSVNVLNTPPDWTVDAEELAETSTTSPTNSGDTVTWVATGTDSNGAPYFLLICDSAASPTANANAGTPGTAPPDCPGGATQWGVSTSTVSGTQASVSTTTLESFAESNDWYAWICDDDAVNPRCNDAFRQGNGSTASPFSVNHRPGFTVAADDSPADPGVLVTWTSTASDTDTDGAADTVQLIICNDNDFGTATSTTECGVGGTIATSTLSATNPSATYTLPSTIQDQDYTAYAFVIDNHGHAALGGAQATNTILTVNNVAPTVDGAQITLNGGDDLVLVTEAGETTGFTLDFVVNDANSCENASSGSEIVDYEVSIYRSGIGSSTCDAAGSNYDPNECYSSGLGTTTWNISCTATTTGSGACTGSTDPSELWECTFPLWYVADPTDFASTSEFAAEDWRAAVSGVDDDAATGPFTESTTSDIEVLALTAFSLGTLAIPYGDLAPGDNTGTLSASTTASSTGNTGVDTTLSGLRMCPTGFAPGACAASATSSIPETEQEYGTSTLPYGSGTSLTTTDALLDLNIAKPTATATQPAQITYWGIEVPATVTLAGIYTGQNSFMAVTSDPSQW